MNDLPATVEKPLTPRQAKFVASYLTHGNGSRAAVEAGYSSKSAKDTAHRLLHESPAVVEAITNIRAKVREQAAYNAHTAMQECERGMALAIEKNQMMAYMRGVELRARLMGFLKDRVEVNVHVTDLRSTMLEARQRVTLAPVIDAEIVTPALPAGVADPFGD